MRLLAWVPPPNAHAEANVTASRKGMPTAPPGYLAPGRCPVKSSTPLGPHQVDVLLLAKRYVSSDRRREAALACMEIEHKGNILGGAIAQDGLNRFSGSRVTRALHQSMRSYPLFQSPPTVPLHGFRPSR
jgi:hypothetical protein